MNKELRRKILDKCLDQVDTCPPDNGHDVEEDFNMAKLEEDGNKDAEIFKLRLKTGLRKKK